jgi:ribonuclease P protein component
MGWRAGDSLILSTDERLRRSERLATRREYDLVFREGGSAGGGMLVVYARPNGLTWSRLGLSVGRKVGSAVLRSLARRRLREAFRRSKPALAVGFDYVCVARAACVQPGADVATELVALAKRAVRKAGRRGDPSGDTP